MVTNEEIIMFKKLAPQYYHNFSIEHQVPFLKRSFTVMLLLLVCNVLAYQFLISNQNSFAFYQTEFSPAVMYACGYSFSNPADDKEIKSFLNKEKHTVNCQDIRFNKLTGLAPFQRLERYLIFSTGIVWKILGIGWTTLIPLFLLLYSASVAAIYFIFRLGMRQSLSFILTLLVTLSPAHMMYLLQLRDYSVAPFLLWAVWISGKLVVDCPKFKSRQILSAICGLLLGIGLGFRYDLFVLIPYFILVSLFFVKKEHGIIVDKLLPLALFCFCFFISAYPILHSVSKQGNVAHVIILGLANDFTQNLKLLQPHVYSIIPAYRDLVAFNVVNSFAVRMTDAATLFLPTNTAYQHYGFLYLYNYVCFYPADVLVRIYASIYQILIYSYQDYSGIKFDILNKSGLFFPLCSFIIIAFYQYRLAFFLGFSIIYLCAYPILQFDPRHYFYLAFLDFWFLGFVIDFLINLATNPQRKSFIHQLKYIIQARWHIVLFCPILLFVLMYSLLYAARIYQTAALINLYNHYLKLPAKELARKKTRHDTITVFLPTMIPNSKKFIQENLYLKISTHYCLTNQISLNLNYLEQPDPSWIAPTAIHIPGGKPGVYFYPIYNFHNPITTLVDVATLPSNWVNSISYASKDDSCLNRFDIVNTKHQAPLQEFLNLQDNWATGPLYQHF